MITISYKYISGLTSHDQSIWTGSCIRNLFKLIASGLRLSENSSLPRPKKAYPEICYSLIIETPFILMEKARDQTYPEGNEMTASGDSYIPGGFLFLYSGVYALVRLSLIFFYIDIRFS